MSDYDRFLPLAEELDRAYSQALDRLHATVVDTAGLNQKVREILERDTPDIVPLNVDSLPAPKDTFVSFAKALAQRVLPELGIDGNETGRLQDLVDWSDAPTRGNASESEYQLARIEHARTKTLPAFLRQLLIRFNPSSMPNAAIHRAVEDLINTFSVPTAMGLAIPLRRDTAPAVMRYVFNRLTDEPMWQLIHRHQGAIIRGTNAMATLALLEKKHTIASGLTDMLNAMDVRLNQTMMRYEPGQAFHASAYMKMTLNRDGADFHLGASLLDVLATSLHRHDQSINLVFH